MSGFAKLCLKTEVAHKEFIILLPYRVSFGIPAGYDALHVIGKNFLRDSHVHERMNHSDEQVLLFCIRKKLNITLSAGVAYHCKTGYLVDLACSGLHGYEAPVHLVAFTRACFIPPTTVTLWSHDLTLGR